MSNYDLLDLFPKDALKLLKANGKDLILQVGMRTIKSIVYDVLVGRNLRGSTEWLTRKRVASLNAATLVMLLRGMRQDAKFLENLPSIAAERLSRKRVGKADKWLLQWLLGLTGKSNQNVLRNDAASLALLRDKYVSLCGDMLAEAEKEYGQITGSLQLNTKEQAELSWSFMLQLMTTVGAQTLSIRGSEKSMYGKFFEPLILGSLLEILGFTRIPQPSEAALTNHKRVFWLSSTDKRESDATLLLDSGRGVRFDIGFIGKGNPEIALDKVTRFEREIEIGARHWYLATIIIVDSIGEKSSISELAKRVQGTIIQMSGSYWPKQVAEVLSEETGFKAELLSVPDSEIAEYLRQSLDKVSFSELLKMAEQTVDLLPDPDEI